MTKPLTPRGRLIHPSKPVIAKFVPCYAHPRSAHDTRDHKGVLPPASAYTLDREQICPK